MTLDRTRFPVIHAVTDTAIVAHHGFIERASAVMGALGPRGAVHLRSSRLTGRKFYEIAMQLANFQKTTGCWLIVNDRIDIGLAVGAMGAQLASHSLAVDEALSVSHDIAIGASVHSIDEAVAAERFGASWCVAGTVFETPSHAGRPPARIEFIELLARAVSIPIIAIGGIRPEDVPPLKRAGAHGVATIRGAGWDYDARANTKDDDLLKTRLPVRADPGYAEPVTRYISAYDSESGSDGNDHPDGERSPAGASA